MTTVDAKPADAKPADVEASFRRGKYAIEAIALMAKAGRDALEAGEAPATIPAIVVAERYEIAAEIAAAEPPRPGETNWTAYARVLPEVEAAVDAAFGVLFPDAAAGV